jgi:hypothetical protein
VQKPEAIQSSAIEIRALWTSSRKSADGNPNSVY